jgi:hypothetical protein
MEEELRLDTTGNAIKHGNKFKIAFRDQDKANTIADTYLVESYKTFNASDDPSQQTCCRVF